MGSVLTRMKKPGYGKLNDPEVYLQFVPGQCVEVVTSTASKTYNRKLDSLNSIIAKPHITTKPLKETMLNEAHRYKPLLRGITEVPVKGDPVLLCTFGGVNYYLGPLNTQGDVNFNIDHIHKPDLTPNPKAGNIDGLARAGVSRNFVKLKQKRLQKLYNEELDNPNLQNKDLQDICGDIVIEGRYGNSIRIGQRYVNPYMIFSNFRSEGKQTESTQDGSLIFLGNRGSIRQHFKNDGEFNADLEETEKIQFTLSDSKVEEPIRTIQGTYSTAIGRGILDSEDEFEADVDIYEYENNQMLLASDRITLNARKESIFASAFQYLHFGAGNSITLTTNNNIHLSAETRVVIDSPIVKLGTDDNEQTEPLVLGDELVIFLEQLMGVIKQMNTLITTQIFATGAGPTAPGPTNSAQFQGLNKMDITTLEDNIQDILSKTNRTT